MQIQIFNSLKCLDLKNVQTFQVFRFKNGSYFWKMFIFKNGYIKNNRKKKIIKYKGNRQERKNKKSPHVGRPMRRSHPAQPGDSRALQLRRALAGPSLSSPTGWFQSKGSPGRQGGAPHVTEEPTCCQLVGRWLIDCVALAAGTVCFKKKNCTWASRSSYQQQDPT